MFEAQFFQNRISVDQLFRLSNLLSFLEHFSVLRMLLLFTIWISLFLSQSLQNNLDSLQKHISRLSRLLLNNLSYISPLNLLFDQKSVKLSNINAILLHVNHAQLFHVFAVLAMFAKNGPKISVNVKELLLKYLLHFFSLRLQDLSAPHSNNFPRLEILEEIFLGYLTELATINQPILQANKFNWLVVFVKRETLLGQRVIAVVLLL